MKLLVSLSSYGDKNLHYLDQVINAYKTYDKYDVTIDVHCTVPLQRNDINQIIHANPATTCLFHRHDFIREQDNYDLFLFSEYDILIKQSAIDTYLKYNNILPADHCLGFIRYENALDNNKTYFIDWWITPDYNYIERDHISIYNKEYFTVKNPHQACYLLTKDKLKYIINNTNFNLSNLGSLGIESSSSSIFSNWTAGPRGIIQKVYPKDKKDIENILIHHMPDIHVNDPGVNSSAEMYRNTTVFLEKLYQNFNL